MYETAGEFFTSGDFNGDGVLDVLVLDKLTGNARVGYAGTDGSLTWSAPLITSVENVSGCAAGHLLPRIRDVLAVTSESLNRVNLFDLSQTNSSQFAATSQASGLGPHALAALASPFGSPPPATAALLIASTLNDSPAARLDIVTSYPIGAQGSAGQYPETASFERANGLIIDTNGPTFAAGLVRGTNDTLHLWQFTNAPAVLLTFSNLPAGSDYVFGNFNGEPLPRFIFYQPGGTNLTVAPLLQSNNTLLFGASILVTVTQSLQQVFYLPDGTTASAILEFADGVQALSLPAGIPALTPKYQSGLGAPGNLFTGVVPLANGQFALFDAPPGSPVSINSQVVSLKGNNFTRLSGAHLPPTTAHGTHANVWLFQLQPFVNGSPGFIESLNSPDWTDGVLGLSNSVQVLKETDTGVTNGLGGLTTANLGSPPAGTAFAIANQLNPALSIFTYSTPQAPDVGALNISPPPGVYASPLTISLSGNGSINYRVGPANSWQIYSAPFAITNDATIQFFAITFLSPTRARMQSASYVLGNPDSGTAPAPVGLNPGLTNPPPVLPTNAVVLSQNGTVFYGRRSASNVGTIWAINLDGSGDTYVTTGVRPRVSRDGQWLAFLREGDPFGNRGNLWARNMQTGVESRLFSNPDYVVLYDWEPDDSALLTDYSCGIYDLSTNGSGALTQLVAVDCYDDAPVRNPVDGRIAFHNLNPSTSSDGLFLVAPNGTGRQRLVSSVGGASFPAWSPDGSELAFADGNNTSLSLNNLWVVHSDGTGLSQITAFSNPTNGFPYGALWAPDGSALVGAGAIFGTNGLWVIPLDPTHDDCNGAPILLPTKPGDPIYFAGSVVTAPATPADVLRPGLYIRRDTGAVVVYWSTNFVGYTLEYTTNLGTPTWTAINGPYYAAGYFYEHWEPQNSLPSARFFRLHAGPANLVFNGSFESTNNAAGLGIASLGLGSGLIPGWTTTNAELAWIGPLSGLNPPLTAFDHSDFLDLTGYHDAAPYGGVYQTIATIPGQTYHVSFALGSDQHFDSLYSGGLFVSPGVTVSVNGNAAFTAFNNFPNQSNHWQVWAFDFNAAAPQTTLQFTSLSTSRVAYIGLDNVVVTSAVPPPLIVLSAPVLGMGQVQIPFNLARGAAATFSLLQAAQPAGPWVTNHSAVLTTSVPGVSYSFTVPQNGAAAFYRVQTP